ncbi:MAG: bifunctional riboflavin kinase/FAD synthetase [Dehalococcoidia bacterium]|nr:bifunctional riboflavin kinase/FAD synthetase [Dehalococcoidia bacterium]
MLLAREELEAAAGKRPSAITVGVFDGVHRGHVHLVQQTIQAARDLGLASGVVTLHPAPEQVLKPGAPVLYLTSLEERVELLRSTGADWVARLTFTSEFAQLSAEDFVTMLQDVAGLRCVVEGPGFALGRRREGTMVSLAELGVRMGFEVRQAAPLVAEDGGVISSTRVREALQRGAMEQVTSLLGRPFSLRGPVVHGAERGRGIGFPTANIAVAPDRQLPPYGVYVTRAFVGEQAQPSVTNIGLRPTFDELTPSVEAHLLDFNGDLYGREMRLEVLSRVRPEMKFSGLDELKRQIAADARAARQYFASADQ